MQKMDAAESRIARMAGAIRARHGCAAEHVETVALCGKFAGDLTWRGRVDVFRVGHPDATRCYAWTDGLTAQGRNRVVTVLGRYAVRSPEDAVGEALLREQLDRRICAYYRRIGEPAELTWSLG